MWPVDQIYEWLLRTFWATKMEVTIVGLQNAGKTTLLRVLGGGEFASDSIPTVGFNLKKIQKGHVTLSCWDIGGQPRFRNMWERYCRTATAVLFVIDSADKDALPVAKEELEMLLRKPGLNHVPLMVLANKSDLPDHITAEEIRDTWQLVERFGDRVISIYGVSAKSEQNIDETMRWLIEKVQ